MSFVADPRRLVTPLASKDGPVERRAFRSTDSDAGAAVPGGYHLPALARRAMPATLVATSFRAHIGRVAELSAVVDAIHASPGHEGTTATCRSYGRRGSGPLGLRVHDCPRRHLVLPRDQASAVGAFRTGAEPGDRIAALLPSGLRNGPSG